jgi:integral membrane protein
MLLVLCVEMFFKYVVPVDVVVDYMGWVPFAHGWIYVVYLVTVLDLWAKMRWGFGRLTTMVLAGVVPVMSFVLEKKVHGEADAKLAALAQRYAVQA